MKSPNLHGWEKLTCPYFARTCQRVLGQYFESNGFAVAGFNEIGGVKYSRFGIFVEVSYELEPVPQALSVVLGIGEKKYDKGGHPCCVPYWYLLPPERPEHRAEQIKFNAENELEKILLRFKNEFLEPYAKPLWLNSDRLERSIANFRAEFSC